MFSDAENVVRRMAQADMWLFGLLAVCIQVYWVEQRDRGACKSEKPSKQREEEKLENLIIFYLLILLASIFSLSSLSSAARLYPLLRRGIFVWIRVKRNNKFINDISLSFFDWISIKVYSSSSQAIRSDKVEKFASFEFLRWVEFESTQESP